MSRAASAASPWRWAHERRTPDEILAEFGRELKRARAPRRRWRFWAAAAVLPVLVVPGAIAARSAWAPAPRVPDAAKPLNAPRPDGPARSVRVLAGDGYTVSAATCRFGAHATVALWLRVDGGGGGRRCEALTPALARADVLPPSVYVDPRTRRTLVFGVARGHDADRGADLSGRAAPVPCPRAQARARHLRRRAPRGRAGRDGDRARSQR